MIDVNLRGVLYGIAAALPVFREQSHGFSSTPCRPRIAIAPDAVARAIAFAIEQPDGVAVGDIVVRPTAQD